MDILIIWEMHRINLDGGSMVELDFLPYIIWREKITIKLSNEH